MDFLPCKLSRNVLFIFLRICLGIGIEKWWGFLVNFSGLHFPRNKARKVLDKFGGKFGATIGAKFGTEIQKIREFSFCIIPDLRLLHLSLFLGFSYKNKDAYLPKPHSYLLNTLTSFESAPSTTCESCIIFKVSATNLNPLKKSRGPKLPDLPLPNLLIHFCLCNLHWYAISSKILLEGCAIPVGVGVVLCQVLTLLPLIFEGLYGADFFGSAES